MVSILLLSSVVTSILLLSSVVTDSYYWGGESLVWLLTEEENMVSILLLSSVVTDWGGEYGQYLTTL